MVESGLLRKQDPPILGGDALYSIKRAGIQALERLGIYYLGASLEREQDGERFQIPHALELNGDDCADFPIDEAVPGCFAWALIARARGNAGVRGEDFRNRCAQQRWSFDRL
jgi:hypothetical protein